MIVKVFLTDRGEHELGGDGVTTGLIKSIFPAISSYVPTTTTLQKNIIPYCFIHTCGALEIAIFIVQYLGISLKATAIKIRFLNVKHAPVEPQSRLLSLINSRRKHKYDIRLSIRKQSEIFIIVLY